jgi:hypothetical protein
MKILDDVGRVLWSGRAEDLVTAARRITDKELGYDPRMPDLAEVDLAPVSGFENELDEFIASRPLAEREQVIATLRAEGVKLSSRWER